MIDPNGLCDALERARAQARPIERLSASHPGMTLDDGYRVQEEGIRRRLSAGDRIAGYKMGLTSRAKMEQMKVDVPIMGVLTEGMRAAPGKAFVMRGLIAPRVEPEIAFVLGRELKGRVSAEEALSACSGVCAALEIIDSRYTAFSFSLPDVVADNCSACAFALGPVSPPAGLSLAGLKIELLLGDKVVQAGSSDAILGHPAQSLAELSALLASRGEAIPAGSVVLSGAATQAVALPVWTEVRATVAGLGDARVQTRG